MKYLSIILISFFLISCGTSKRIKPDWVQSRPISQSYYIGIGIAQKNKSVTYSQCIESAKKNALSDMAGEISSRISASSVLNTMDLGTSFNEEFSSRIKTSYELDIEGYEQVGFYENENEIWIYYRLNKEAHRLKNKQKQDLAALKAVDFYSKAKISENDYEYNQALVYYVKALETLKNYLDQNLEVSINGKKTFIISEIISEIGNLLKSVKIEFINKSITVKRGDILYRDDLKFFIRDNKTSHIIKEFPLDFYYSGSLISQKNIIHNLDDSYSYELGKISSKKNIEIFEVRINIMDFTKNITSDPFILKIIEKISVHSSKISINVEPSSIYININERNIGNNVESEILGIIKNTLEKEKIYIESNEKKADFILNINIETREKSSQGNLFIAELLAKFEVINKKNNVVFNYILNNIQSRGNSFKEAGEKCYKDAEREVRFKISRQIYTGVF